MNHVAPKFGLAGSKGSKLGKRGAGELDEKEREEAEEERTIINQLVLTGMDLCAEVSRFSLIIPALYLFH